MTIIKFVRYFGSFLAFLCLLTAISSCVLHRETNVEIGNREQILYFGNGDEPQELDPAVTTGIPEYQIQEALFEGLVSLDPKTLAIVPGVAKSWDVSPDHKTYIFHLRKNARWSNGDRFTAHDFVYSWKRALTPRMGNLYAYMLYYLKNGRAYATGKIKDFSKVGVKALDDYTLKVDLQEPTPYFLQLLDHQSYYPVEKATVEKFGAFAERGTRWTRPGNFVGNGPFKLKTWKMNRVLIVEKSPTYWDAPRVRLKEIYFYPISNESTEERMFRAGQLHITESIPTYKIADYERKDPGVVHITPWAGTYFYRFNTTIKPLNDVRVRRALALSINREEIVKRVTRGGEIPAYTFTPPGINGYYPAARLEYNVEKARKLLAAAGYPNGKGFPRLEIIYNTNEQHRQVAIAIQEMWKKALNIHITLANLDWKVFLDRESHLDYQISRGGWIADYLDPTNFLDLFVTGGGNNRTGWSNAQYDKYIHEAALAANQAQRYAIFQKAEKLLMQQVPIVPIYTYTRRRLIAKSVKGWYDNILDRHHYQYIYLDSGRKK